MTPTDPVAAEIAWQERAEAELLRLWGTPLLKSQSLLIAHAAKCRKLIAALMAEHAAREAYLCGTSGDFDELVAAFRRSHHERLAAIAEFTAPEKL